MQDTHVYYRTKEVDSGYGQFSLLIEKGDNKYAVASCPKSGHFFAFPSEKFIMRNAQHAEVTEKASGPVSTLILTILASPNNIPKQTIDDVMDSLNYRII